MTGLDSANDQIIEIATVVTDYQLQEIAVGPELVISQPRSVMDAMDDWNTRQHGESGLTERVLESSVSLEQAEKVTLNFLREHVGAGVSPMCGNSICQDRRFLARLMPDLEAYFHYRNLDVSTLKILASAWHPEVAAGYSKEASHRALDDIRNRLQSWSIIGRPCFSRWELWTSRWRQDRMRPRHDEIATSYWPSSSENSCIADPCWK